MDDSDTEKRARLLCQSLVDAIPTSNICSVTTSIYDTAWLSMISKPEGDHVCWLFPESYQYILSQQLPSGGWEAYARNEDGIMNSLAALLALKRHQSSTNPDVRLQDAIERATMFLESALQTIDADAGLPIAFELLVPAHLAMLDREGIHLSSPAIGSLLAKYESKMDGFNPELLYGTAGTTLLHSLEALITKIDFDRIRHRKTFGSMMGSPASTAAYLIDISSWDNEAENYLKRVILECSEDGNGAVPCLFPIDNFGILWVTSTLLHSGFSVECLGMENIQLIASYLEQPYHAQNDLIGFTASVLADADDSAKAISTLNLLGRHVHAKSLVEKFWSQKGHFQNYTGERNASLSTNCNVLRALLEVPNARDHVAEITSILEFLCEAWWNGATKDKWNIASQYTSMLLAEASVRLFEVWDNGHLEQLPDALLRNRLPIVMVQILTRTLMDENVAALGGENQYLEATAYAILTLKSLSSLPWFGQLKEIIFLRIEQSQKFLQDRGTCWDKPQYLWTGKISYGVRLFSEAYFLAAIAKMKQPYPWTEKVSNLVHISEKEEKKVTHLFSKLQCFQSAPAWKVHASVVEGLFFLPQLRWSFANVMGRERSAKNEYLSFIPCTWVIINNIHNIFIDAYLLWDMMVFTLAMYRLDEYMESKMPLLGEVDLRQVKTAIQATCDSWDAREHPPSSLGTKNMARRSSPEPLSHRSNTASTLTTVCADLSSFIDAMLGNPRITHASKEDGSALNTALSTHLQSHIDQCLTNIVFVSQKPSSSHSKPQICTSLSFNSWLHTIAVPSIGSPFTLAFLTCLVGGIPTPAAKYLHADFNTRLAVFTRMYNDYGSAARDMEEGNVNCINFYDINDGKDVETAKKRLLELARYERDAARWVGARLMHELRRGKGKDKDKGRKADAVGWFLGVTELYAELYEVRDLSNRLDGGN